MALDFGMHLVKLKSNRMELTMVLILTVTLILFAIKHSLHSQFHYCSLWFIRPLKDSIGLTSYRLTSFLYIRREPFSHIHSRPLVPKIWG